MVSHLNTKNANYLFIVSVLKEMLGLGSITQKEYLRAKNYAIQELTSSDNSPNDRLDQIQRVISEREQSGFQYDDSIVRQMIECIKVYPSGKLDIIFGGGYIVEENITAE